MPCYCFSISLLSYSNFSRTRKQWICLVDRHHTCKLQVLHSIAGSHSSAWFWGLVPGRGVSPAQLFISCIAKGKELPEVVSHNYKKKNRPFNSLYTGCEIRTPGNCPNLTGQNPDFEVVSALSQIWTKWSPKVPPNLPHFMACGSFISVGQLQLTLLVRILTAVSTNVSMYSEVCWHKQCFSGNMSL